MNRQRFDEGMIRGALDHLVQPLLSIDEYHSKISDSRVIVVGFFVNDQDPANDLSNFIDRSSLPVLDTDVSPSPTPEGYYAVFVELKRDGKFPDVLMSLLDEVKNITNVKEWEFTCPLHGDPVELDIDGVRECVELDPAEITEEPDKDEEQEEEEEKVTEDFWKAASVDSITVYENHVIFSHVGREYEYEAADGIPKDAGLLFENQDARKLQALLGPAYDVSSAGDVLVIQGQDGYCCLRPA